MDFVSCPRRVFGNDLKVADDFDKKKFVQDAIAAE